MQKERQAEWFALALAGCAALPFYAFVSGHPFRIRYMILLITAAAACIGLLVTVTGLGHWFNDLSAERDSASGPLIFFIGVLLLIWMFFGWFGSVVREDRAGLYSAQMDRSFRWGMSWFIFSEVMFFAAFFGTLFYIRYWTGPWLGGEGDKGISNMLWPNFEYTWPLLRWLAATLEELPYLRDDELAQAGARLVYYMSCPATRASFASAAREMVRTECSIRSSRAALSSVPALVIIDVSGPRRSWETMPRRFSRAWRARSASM